MADLHHRQDVFDFSLDAQDFKKRLHQQLMEMISASALEPVDDQDLEWVNAAGEPHLPPDDENRCDRRMSKRIE